jgi:hypothetical protein
MISNVTTPQNKKRRLAPKFIMHKLLDINIVQVIFISFIFVHASKVGTMDYFKNKTC